MTVCLEGLENILRVGEAEKNLGKTDSVNVFAQAVEDAEGLDKIENLQNHDNSEIYERAVKILETFWPEDAEEGVANNDSAPAEPGFRFDSILPSGVFKFG